MRWFSWRRREGRRANVGTPGSGAGRQHALGVPYALPQDFGEINRLDFQHYLLRHAFRGNFAAPLGAWGERVGVMMAADFFSGIRALAGPIATLGIASQTEFERTLAAAQAHVNTPEACCVAPFYVAWGQRPS